MWRRVGSGLVTAAALALVWLILVLPADLRDLDLRLFLLVPAEGLALLACVLWVPEHLRARVIRWGGWSLAVVLVLRLFDLGFDAVFDRPLDLVNDGVYLRAAVEVIAYDYGWAGAVLSLALLVSALGGLMMLLPRLLGRLAGVSARHRSAGRTALIVLGVVWLIAAGLGWRTSPRTPVAARTVVSALVDRTVQGSAALTDRRRFDQEIASDPAATAPPSGLLAGLRGKDVLVVFVESYGRVALEDPEVSAGVHEVLAEGERTLAAAGFSACSGLLTSPTFGAASWLAHATLQSGLWVDSQYRYNRLLLSDRLTLTDSFAAEGWRTVVYAPAITKPWPEGQRFYGFDELVRGNGLQYAGPRFGFDSVPDQFTLGRLHERELATPNSQRTPVMAEVNLISSHHPWTPVPGLVDWSRATDPAAYAGQLEGQPTQRELFGDPDRVRAAYGAAIEYSLATVLSFVATYGDEDLVVLLVGDHQPHSYVSGAGSGREVPVSLISGDPGVLAAIGRWGWKPGLAPAADAVPSRMDAVRDRFYQAFGYRAFGYQAFGASAGPPTGDECG